MALSGNDVENQLDSEGFGVRYFQCTAYSFRQTLSDSRYLTAVHWISHKTKKQVMLQ